MTNTTYNDYKLITPVKSFIVQAFHASIFIKIVFFVTDALAKWDGVFVHDKDFQASLIFVSKARSMNIEWGRVMCSTWVRSSFV
jgi:hypothetical protein